MPFFNSKNDKKVNTDGAAENSPHLLWRAIIGGALCAGLGTWIYPDIGTIIGATIGIIGGVYLGDFLRLSKTEENEEITFEVSSRAKHFFADLDIVAPIDTKINLPSLEKKPVKPAEHDDEYYLRLFHQATTLRGTRIFPHKKKLQKKKDDTDSKSKE